MPSPTPFAGVAPDRIIWVSPDGNDGNSGSREAPLASIQLAIDRTTPGTAILLMPGDYHGNFQFEKIEGTSDKPIWLAAAAGPGTANIFAVDATQSIITIRGEDNLVIRDLVLTGGKDGIEVHQSGLDFTDLAQNIVIAGNRIVGAAEDAIKVGEGVNIHVVGNSIDGAGDQGIDFLAVVDGEISGNEIENVTGSSGLFAKGGSSNLIIADNYIHDVAGDGLLVGGNTSADNFLPGTDYEAKDVVVVGNVVESAVKRPLSVLGGQNVDIHGNFFASQPTNEHVVLVGPGSPEVSPTLASHDVFIHDNIFDRASNFSDVDPTSTNVVFADNVQDGTIDGDMRPSPLAPDGAFVDTVAAGVLNAWIWTSSARSTANFSGTSDADNLIGTDGNDFLSGGGDDDVTTGGRGDDVDSVGNSRDVIVEQPGEGIDTAYVYGSLYTLSDNVENLTVKTAGGGTFTGNGLNNILSAGVGNDVLSGGLGDDLFVFTDNASADRIADFAAGPGSRDTIDLLAFAELSTFGDVLARASQVGADTVIAFDNGGTLTLANVARESLTAGDFMLGGDAAGAPNQAPTALTLADATVALGSGAVAENSAVGTVVGTLVVSDPDTDDRFAYTMIDDGDGLFALQGKSIVVAGAIDYEAAASHEVRVRVTDWAFHSFEQSFTIAIADVGGVSLAGTAGNDSFGAAGQSKPTIEADTIQAGGGNDMIDGLAGADFIDGGAGIDTVSYVSSAAGVAADLASHLGRGGSADGDQLFQVENLFGSAFADSLIGDRSANTLAGFGGADVLVGGAGKDRLDGGPGGDWLFGGAGHDTFVFSAPIGVDVDTVVDFHRGKDAIALSRAVFQHLRKSDGHLADASFSADGHAHKAAQHILYNPHTGALSYDPDGRGHSGAVEFALLASHLHLTAADFLLI